MLVFNIKAKQLKADDDDIFTLMNPYAHKILFDFVFSNNSLPYFASRMPLLASKKSLF